MMTKEQKLEWRSERNQNITELLPAPAPGGLCGTDDQTDNG